MVKRATKKEKRLKGTWVQLMDSNYRTRNAFLPNEYPNTGEIIRLPDNPKHLWVVQHIAPDPIDRSKL